MEQEHLRDTVLKPILCRVRNHQSRSRRGTKRRKENEKPSSRIIPRTRQNVVNVGVDAVAIDHIRNVVADSVARYDIGRIVQLKDEVDSHMRELLCSAQKSWLSKMDAQDVTQLMTALDPMSMAVSKVMSLPKMLSTLFDMSSLDLQPSIYTRDHLWLTLQWSIDGVENPFASRPCASMPCLGMYIASTDEAPKTPLPELVPLSVLDKLREFRCQGMTTEQFRELLQERRKDSHHVAGDYSLGRDVSMQPKCALCYIKAMFSLVTDPTNSCHKSISLESYTKGCLFELEGIRRDILIDFEATGFRWKLRESGCDLPRICLPLPSAVMDLLQRKGNGEIYIDDLYD